MAAAAQSPDPADQPPGFLAQGCRIEAKPLPGTRTDWVPEVTTHRVGADKGFNDTEGERSRGG